jgi:hypothetical protein
MLAATPKQGASMSDDDNVEPGGGTSIPPSTPGQTGGDPTPANPSPADPTPVSAGQPSLWERIKKMFGG